MPPSSLYCCHKSASMSSAAARNRRISASPRVRPPLALAARALANSPAPIVPAPTASDLPKKERRLIKLFVDLLISDSRSTLPSRFPSHVGLPILSVHLVGQATDAVRSAAMA